MKEKRIYIRTLKILIMMVVMGFSLLYCYTLYPKTDIDHQVDGYFFQALEKSKILEYREALKLTKKISELVPDHPAGYLFSSAILNWIIADFYNFDYTDEFLDEIDKTIKLSKKKIQNNRLDPWGYIYLGGAYGFRGIYYSLIGSFYSAFVDGVRGNFELNKAISMDPNIYDNYFGTGTFDFWKAYYSGKFFWLGTAENNKQKGIDKINLAISKGKYTTLEAEFSLIRIYLVDGRYQEAVDKAKEMIAKSPRSVKVRRFMGIAYRELGKHEEALKTFHELRRTIEVHELRTPAALLEVDMNIARSYRYLKQFVEALATVENSQKYYKQIDPKNDFLEELIEEYDNLIIAIRKDVTLNH